MRKKVVQRKKAVFVGTFFERISLICTCRRVQSWFPTQVVFSTVITSVVSPQSTEDEGSGHTLPQQ